MLLFILKWPIVPVHFMKILIVLTLITVSFYVLLPLQNPGIGIPVPLPRPQEVTLFSNNSTVSNMKTCSNYSTAKDLSARIWLWWDGGSSAIGKVYDQLFERSGLSQKDRVDPMLLIRKLVLYSVHLMNARMKSNPLCVEWWANPLTVWRFSSIQVDSEVKEWTLRFKLEPGQLPVETVIRQKSLRNRPVNLKIQQEFELVSVKELTKDKLILDCLCESGKEEPESITMKARTEWNQTIPELEPMPPNTSFIITDYVDFLDESYFLLSPGKFRNQNTSYCGPRVKIIVLIHSAPQYFERREAIRKTYGTRQNLEKFNTSVVFFFGTTSDLRLQEQVNKEMKEFDDIVQANFVDSYHNLTLKHLSLMQWIYLRCTNGSESKITNLPRHILKADDDVMLNIESGLRVAQTNPDAGMIGFFRCNRGLTGKDTLQKWYIPRYIYPATGVHGLLLGAAYLLQGKLIPQLLQATLTTPIMHVDDLFIMGGVLSREINIVPEGSALFSVFASNQSCFNRIRVNSPEIRGLSNVLAHWNDTFLKPSLFDTCSLSTVNFKSIKMDCSEEHYDCNCRTKAIPFVHR